MLNIHTRLPILLTVVARIKPLNPFRYILTKYPWLQEYANIMTINSSTQIPSHWANFLIVLKLIDTTKIIVGKYSIAKDDCGKITNLTNSLGIFMAYPYLVEGQK